ncbi:MAG: hypothetical protein CSA81_08415 [Acidobacteria bacterium]|nr:MAG: hypothetical protein CSA81_08415 [Acidobacteriota bacterium]PIE90304.1 MAG: hypothetical protein CR997_06860 [Acidobacteriota bacterium]
MTKNDILRRFRYAMNLSDEAMLHIFGLKGKKLTRDELLNLLKKEGEEGYAYCSSDTLELFLDGFILYKRGVPKHPKPPVKVPLTNNVILRKLKIALNLKDSDMIQIMALARFRVSKSELNALFRKESHLNYKACGDQFLRNFINGCAVKYRQGL